MTQSFANDGPHGPSTTAASPVLAGSNKFAAQHDINRKKLQSQGGHGEVMNSPHGVNHASVDESGSYPGSNSVAKTRASSNIVGMQRVPNG